MSFEEWWAEQAELGTAISWTDSQGWSWNEVHSKELPHSNEEYKALARLVWEAAQAELLQSITL